MEIQKNEKDKKSMKYLFIMLGLILLLNIGFIFNWYKKSNEKNQQLTTQNQTLGSENTQLKSEIESLETEFNSLKSDNDNLKGQLDEKEKLLAEKLTQIKVMLKKGNLSAQEIEKAKQEINDLKIQIADYKVQIERLQAQVNTLETEKTGLTEELNNERSVTQQQSRTIEAKEKELNKAKRLVLGYISATGVRERKIFGKKEVETDKASKTEEVKVSFTINENSVANTGDKDVFVKIISPDGSPIATKVQTTNFEGTETLYTEKKTIDYNSEKQDVIVYCKKQGDFKKGEYTVEVFSEGFRIGTTKFTLK